MCPHMQRPPVSQAFLIHTHTRSWHLPPRPWGLHTPAGLLVSDLCTPERRGPRGTGPPERGDLGASLSHGRFLSPSPTYRVDPDPLSTPHQLGRWLLGGGLHSSGLRDTLLSVTVPWEGCLLFGGPPGTHRGGLVLWPSCFSCPVLGGASFRSLGTGTDAGTRPPT